MCPMNVLFKSVLSADRNAVALLSLDSLQCGVKWSTSMNRMRENERVFCRRRKRGTKAEYYYYHGNHVKSNSLQTLTHKHEISIFCSNILTKISAVHPSSFLNHKTISYRVYMRLSSNNCFGCSVSRKITF